MNIKNIRQLARIMEESGLFALEIKEGDSSVRLERAACAEPAPAKAAKASKSDLPSGGPAEAAESVVDFNNLYEVKSPVVGVFYAAPAEGEKPFVSVGDRVKKGEVLCIVEAMKVMNEIQAEKDGEIVDICVENGQVVEFSQVLFKIF